MNNIFVLGPVAAGKNTLLDNISDNFDVISLDTGRIFRYISFELYNKLNSIIDFEKIVTSDEKELEKMHDKIFHLSKFINDLLKNLHFEKDRIYCNNIEIKIDDLYGRNTNLLLPIIAKIKMIREKILNFIDEYISIADKPIIMSGHKLNEIDTSKFTVVFLDVETLESADRLYNRNINSYNSISDALDEVNKRNSLDSIVETKKILPFLYNYIYIDTSNKSSENVYNEFLSKFDKISKSNICFNANQEYSIDREQFEWILNPFLEPIRNKLKDLTLPIVKEFPYINQNALIYQTLIILTSHDINEIYMVSDNNYLKSISNDIDDRNSKFINDFYNMIESSKISINSDIILKDLSSALSFLQELYKDDSVKDIMCNYNTQYDKDNLVAHNGFVNISDNLNSDNITIKVINPEMSKFISKYCHYLHTPREDEFIAYGAFKNNEEYPIAYVSFSKQDRGYKKQLLYNIGIEPQNSIEMTRAWCSNGAPINIMSYLFQYSIDDISKKWKDLSNIKLIDKDLQAVTTAINPNLGFKASSFFGCNFIPIAMRPAKFTFVEKNGIIMYETRRRIESSDEDTKYMENKLNILPLNELILCLDKRRRENIKNSNILLINKDEYEEVLKDKSLIKKWRINDEDINSNAQ